MELKKLATLTFDKNVGPTDRVLRVLSGGGLIVAGWSFALPGWLAILLTVLGVMWTATGVLSRCSIYYLLGYSTCPASRFPVTPRVDARATRSSSPARTS